MRLWSFLIFFKQQFWTEMLTPVYQIDIYIYKNGGGGAGRFHHCDVTNDG